MRSKVSTDLAARGIGFAVNPLDSRFDEVEVSHCKAVLRAKADAFLEAYRVYDLTPDNAILEELCSHQRQLVDARRNSLRGEAGMRAARTGRNPAPDVARAEALAQKIERSTHAFLGSLACEIEKGRHMQEERRGPTNILNVTGNIINSNVAQGHSATIINETVDVFATIQESIQNSPSSQQEKAALLAALESLQHTTDKPSFLKKSQQFVGLVASCVQLAPHIATWGEQLANFARTHL
jgi:hypothetical protein